MSESTKKMKKRGAGGFYAVMLGLLLLALAANAIWGQLQADDRAKRIALASEMKVLSQQIATNASEAAQGTESAFSDLSQAKITFDGNLRKLLVGDDVSGLPKPPASIANNELAALDTLWKQVEPQTQTILDNQEVVGLMYSRANELSTAIPELQDKYSNVISTLLDTRASSTDVLQASRQTWLAERISSGLQKVLRGGDDAKIDAQRFGQDVATFGDYLLGALEGDEMLEVRRVTNPGVRTALEAIDVDYQDVSSKVDYIIFGTPKLFAVQDSSDVIFNNAETLLSNTTAVEEAFTGVSQGLQEPGSPLISLALFAAVLLLLVLMYLNQRKSERVRLQDSEVAADREKEENARNQEAIIRLLDEIDSLADGDLTVKATVTEDFTGAIADSFNLTIDQLRGVVGAINETVGQVTESTESTQQTSIALADASRQQAQEITGASAAINEMAVSIEQVSTNASESSQVAERSVEIAKKGGEVVRNTINGMDTIREQIQETSKRIKRLGESSQEIGNIVSLINDIADQTNILALNAAIQASAAGEAGRGFAVVADEVQRLAERSGNATKQIEALVKTIQADTNEAVISMEDTTSEVVRGARLAQDAGVSLEEIESVSTNLADLIQSISNAARQQSASAGHVSNTMTVIQEITTQTSEGTQETADSVGILAKLSDELRRSVAGFKLDSSNEDFYMDEAEVATDVAGFETDEDISLEEMFEQEDNFEQAEAETSENDEASELDSDEMLNEDGNGMDSDEQASSEEVTKEDDDLDDFLSEMDDALEEFNELDTDKLEKRD